MQRATKGGAVETASDGVAEQAVLDVLDRLGVEYETIAVDPRYADTADFCERYGFPLETSANTIIVVSKRGEKRYAACVVTADRRLDVNRSVRRLLGVSKASFASAEETRELTGMEIGGVTVFGLPSGVPIYVDEQIMEIDRVVLGGGGRSQKIQVAPRVLERLPAVTLVPGLGIAPPGR